MKVRTGFVSNSSSTSFVVLLPKDLKFKDLKITEEVIEIVKESNEEATNKEVIKLVEKSLNNLVKTGLSMDEENCDTYLLAELLHEYIIAEIESGPDGEGSLVLADNKKIEKILSKRS